MPQFFLKINLGNESMILDRDISRSLKEVSEMLQEGRKMNTGENWTIRDDNGNLVGEWRII